MLIRLAFSVVRWHCKVIGAWCYTDCCSEADYWNTSNTLWFTRVVLLSGSLVNYMDFCDRHRSQWKGNLPIAIFALLQACDEQVFINFLAVDVPVLWAHKFLLFTWTVDQGKAWWSTSLPYLEAWFSCFIIPLLSYHLSCSLNRKDTQQLTKTPSTPSELENHWASYFHVTANLSTLVTKSWPWMWELCVWEILRGLGLFISGIYKCMIHICHFSFLPQKCS